MVNFHRLLACENGEFSMASATRKLKIRRAINKARAGKTRKNALKLHGSTKPRLALDKPNANEKAQAK